MGREWLYWIGGGATRRRRQSAGIITNQDQDDTTTTSPAGCMCAVFHLFDMHHFNLPLNHQHSHTPFLQQQLKGVEAPRNSLEMEAPPPAAVKVASNPPPIAIQEEEKLNFPARIQIKTRTSTSKSTMEDITPSPCMDSPGTKTPSIVARLMGLDLLPETNSPSMSNSKSHLNQVTKPRNNRCFYDDDINVGARSSSSARRSDVEYYHRLSLQIPKHNTNEDDEFALSSKSARAGRSRQQDENRSPRHYAKQIVKQVRESVGRRVGLVDITNTNRDEIRRDQNLIKLSKKNTSLTHDTKQSNIILETKKNRHAAETTAKSPRNSTSSDTTPSKPKHHQPHKEKFNKFNKLSPQPCVQSIRNKKEEAFVRSPAGNKLANSTEKKSKKAPLSSELLYLGGPTILPVKKGPSPPATKLPQKQAQVSDALSSKRNTQLSSNTSRSYKQLPHQIFTAPLPDSTNGCATAPSSTSAAAEYKCYIQKILKRAGIIDKLTPLTLGKWHTPSHPLDPSIFYYLELFHPAAAPSASSALTRRCDRKLIFQLVDELLVDILRPHLDSKPWNAPSAGDHHFALVDELCKKIESFPGADCRVLEDIDFLVERDLCKSEMNLEEEGERLVRELEGEIVERLVCETVAVAVVDGVRTGRQKGWMSRGGAFT